jgi:hypothetical protein
MSAWSDNDHRVMRWRSSESMTELLLPPGFNGDGWWVGLDASAHWVGQHFDDDVLSVQAVPTVPGEPSRREIGEHDVPGEAISHVVWHDTEPGHLAWLECLNLRDGPTTVVTLDASDPSADPIRVRSFDQGCPPDFWGDDESDAGKPAVTVERWGSTGVWVAKWAEDAEGQDVIESVLLDADGAEIAMVSDARVIAMSPDGTSIWRPVDWEDPCFVLSPDGQQRSAVPGIAAEDFIYGARWSPDGTRFAMSVDTGGGFRSAEGVLRIVDSVSGEVITEIAEPALDGWGSTLAWSTDSRFLVYELVYEGVPSTDTAVLVIHDTVTNTTTKIPLSEYVDEIRVR